MYTFSATGTSEATIQTAALNLTVSTDSGTNFTVTNQYPIKKNKVVVGSKVFLLTNGTTFKMPDVAGWSSNEIITFCKAIDLKYTINGYGKVTSVSIPAGSPINFETTLEINLGS